MPEDERLLRHANIDAASPESPLSLFSLPTWAARVIFEHFETRQNSGFEQDRRFQSWMHSAPVSSSRATQGNRSTSIFLGNQHAFRRPIDTEVT
jgi:hypothetical protein